MSADAATPRRGLAIAGTLVGLVVFCLVLGAGLVFGCLIATKDPVATIRAVVAGADVVAIATDLLWMARIVWMIRVAGILNRSRGRA